MLNQAIKKLRDEMEKNNDASIKRVGNYLLYLLESRNEIAENINAADKTITGSLQFMHNTVMETIKQSERKGMVPKTITDEEGFTIILKYFNITNPHKANASEQPSAQEVDSVDPVQVEIITPQPVNNVNSWLDDLD